MPPISCMRARMRYCSARVRCQCHPSVAIGMNTLTHAVYIRSRIVLNLVVRYSSIIVLIFILVLVTRYYITVLVLIIMYLGTTILVSYIHQPMKSRQIIINDSGSDILCILPLLEEFKHFLNHRYITIPYF